MNDAFGQISLRQTVNSGLQVQHVLPPGGALPRGAGAAGHASHARGDQPAEDLLLHPGPQPTAAGAAKSVIIEYRVTT